MKIRDKRHPQNREPRVCFNCGETEPDTKHKLFCPTCGKAYDPDRAKAELRSVKGGAFGVVNSNSDQIDAFWATGDPAVFEKPKSSQPPMFD